MGYNPHDHAPHLHHANHAHCDLLFHDHAHRDFLYDQAHHEPQDQQPSYFQAPRVHYVHPHVTHLTRVDHENQNRVIKVYSAIIYLIHVIDHVFLLNEIQTVSFWPIYHAD